MKTPSWDAAVLDAKRLVARVQKCQAYQFADGFDNYNAASQMYESVSGTVTYSTAYRRFAPPAGLPGQGVQFGSGATIIKTMKSNQATFIIKVAVYFASLGGASSVGNPFLGVLDSSTYQWCLVVFPSGALAIIHNGTGPIEIQTGPGVVAAGGFYSIEAEVTVNGSAGTAQVWVNGLEVINATGINTQASGNAYGNRVALGDLSNNGLGGMLADDFRVWDNTTAYQSAPIGTDSRIITKLPNAPGLINTYWTPNGAAANWQCVDDNPPDGDTTYLSCSTALDSDDNAMQSAGFTVAPVMVVARSMMRKDDSATRTAAVGVLSGASGSTGAAVAVGSTYAFMDACIPLDPSTSAPPTAAGADALHHLKEEFS